MELPINDTRKANRLNRNNKALVINQGFIDFNQMGDPTDQGTLVDYYGSHCNILVS